jgi:hypothetical protein
MHRTQIVMDVVSSCSSDLTPGELLKEVSEKSQQEKQRGKWQARVHRLHFHFMCAYVLCRSTRAGAK